MADISRRDLLVGGGLLLAASSSRLSTASPDSSNATTPEPARHLNRTWIQTARVLIAEAYNPPFYPELDYDPEKAVRIATALNANAFRYPAASYYAYFPTRTKFPVHPKLVGDPMRETFRLCRAANLKTIAYVPINHPFMDVNAIDPNYPMWQRRDAHGSPFITTHMGFSRFYEGCLNSPLTAELVALLHEVLEYEVDLVYFDGPYQGMDHRAEFCHCEWCKRAFINVSGHDIPAQDGPADAIIEYTRWMNEDVARGVLQKMTNTVREATQLPVLFNNTSLLSRGWCRSHSIPVTDGFMFEAAETPEQKLFNLQLGKSTGKIIWTYLGYHSQYNREHLMDKSIRGWYGYPVDGDDLLMDGAVAFSASAGLVFWSLSRLYAMPQPPEHYAEGRNIRAIFDLMERNEDLAGSSHAVPQAGLLVSSQTIEWCNARSYIPPAYPNGFHGIWQVMQQGSITSEPFLDFAFQRRQLDRYRLIYVSNAACLSHAQCAMLADFVASGGTLIATHLSGLYDEFGRGQVERPFHDLLGIKFSSDEPEERPELYLELPGREELIPQDPQIVRFDPLPGTSVLATTYDLAHHEHLGPAITQRKHGKGQAFYIGSNLEAIYDETRMPVIRDFLLGLMEPVLASSRLYRISAQDGLMAQYMESQNILVLHLMANTGDKLKKLRASESYMPLANTAMAFRIPAGKTVSSVHLLRANKPIVYEQQGEWVSAKIDEFYIHEAVVVRLK